MFRNLMYILITLCIVLSSTNTEAGRKRGPKSGKIKKGIFVDNKYDFEVVIVEKWKGKTQKENSICRLTITFERNKSDIRTDIAGVDGFELSTPFISFWVIETDVSCRDYLDNFLKNPTASKTNKKIITMMQASWTDMNFKHFKTWTYSKFSIDDRKGVNWVGLLNSNYKSSDADLLYQLYTIFDCIQMDDKTILFIAGRTEPEHFNKISGQLQYIMRSVKWAKVIE